MPRRLYIPPVDPARLADGVRAQSDGRRPQRFSLVPVGNPRAGAGNLASIIVAIVVFLSGMIDVPSGAATMVDIL